jgi:hypothetical protein
VAVDAYCGVLEDVRRLQSRLFAGGQLRRVDVRDPGDGDERQRTLWIVLHEHVAAVDIHLVLRLERVLCDPDHLRPELVARPARGTQQHHRHPARALPETGPVGLLGLLQHDRYAVGIDPELLTDDLGGERLVRLSRFGRPDERRDLPHVVDRDGEVFRCAAHRHRLVRAHEVGVVEHRRLEPERHADSELAPLLAQLSLPAPKCVDVGELQRLRQRAVVVSGVDLVTRGRRVGKRLRADEVAPVDLLRREPELLSRLLHHRGESEVVRRGAETAVRRLRRLVREDGLHLVRLHRHVERPRDERDRLERHRRPEHPRVAAEILLELDGIGRHPAVARERTADRVPAIVGLALALLELFDHRLLELDGTARSARRVRAHDRPAIVVHLRPVAPAHPRDDDSELVRSRA